MKIYNHLALTIALFASASPAVSFSISYQRLSNVVTNKHSCVMRLNPTSFQGTDFVITEYPRPALRRVPNEPITEFDDAFETMTQEMLMVMYESKGVGLAAPQIGLNQNVFVYNPSDSKSMERIVCNPKVTKYSDEVVVEQEGCLSLRSDECAGQVARCKWIEVEYMNERGQKVIRRLKDFEARVFQHEYDHLKGILCVDRFPPEDREAAQENINKLLGLYTESDAAADPDAEEFNNMVPRPLSARYMPPLEVEEEEEEHEQQEGKSGGFGGGGFGTGGGKKATKKKKETKKKMKARDGTRSDNPMFKKSGKTAFANRN
mmetsp:Transcript_11237/g.18575  ORF Transcript_11237/g.18575 Transcript_11237/m.18575 type:complete len:319 (-) Transcript_11237:4-960(-)